MRAFVLAVAVLALAGSAAAKKGGRQISVPSPSAPIPSPPPPAPTGPSGPTYETVGFVFSFIVPGFTPLSFNGDKQKAFCAEVVSAQGLSNKLTLECSLETVSSFNGTDVIVSGFAYAKWSTVPTPTEVGVLVALRDAWLKTLTEKPATVFKNFPGTVPNCACAGLAPVTKPSTSPFTYTTTVLAQGPLQCDARLTYAGNTPVTNDPNGITRQVGVDDGTTVASNRGKYCSNPRLESGVTGTPGVGSCIVYGVIAQPAGTQQAFWDSANTVVNNGMVSLGGVGNLVFPIATGGGSGYLSNPAVSISAPNPTPAVFTYQLFPNGKPLNTPGTQNIGNLGVEGVTGIARNGPYVAASIATLTFLEDVCVDEGIPPGVGINLSSSTLYACSGPLKTITFQSSTYNGRVCTVSDFNNGVGGDCGDTVNGCMVMGTDVFANQHIDSAFFPGWDTYCSKPPALTVSTANLQAPVQATGVATINAGGAVDQLTITNQGSGYRTIPSITFAPPTSGSDIGKLCSPNPISGLDSAIAVSVPIVDGVTVGGQCQPIGRDSYLNKPCSIPAAPSGVYAPLNAFTCNVISSFRTQPTEPNALGACAVLPQSVVIPVPGPAPSPSPTPSPSTSPSPSPTPSPSPLPANSCAYQGVYRIESIACSGKFLAYSINGSSDTCKNTDVLLRSAKQSASPRRNWILNAVAEEGKTINGSSVQAAGRIPRCPGTNIINLASANSSPTPRLAGGSWKLRIAPAAYANCAVVTLQATGGTYAGRYLGTTQCTNQRGFVWIPDSGASSAQWKLKKV